MIYKTQRQRLDIMISEMDQQRSSFISHWRDLADHLMPRRAAFTLSETNRGEKRNQRIIDSTGTQSLNILRAGMMAGITSPARPWFKLETQDPELNEFGPVKIWLSDVQRIMLTTFAKSNFYNTMSMMFGDLGCFGTAPISMEEDFTGEVLHTSSYPVGSYWIAKDHKGRINTFAREYRMTVAQILGEFAVGKDGKIDWSNLSGPIKSAYDRGQLNTEFYIVHVIEPNYEHNPNQLTSKKWNSYYYERGGVNRGSQRDNVGMAGDDKFLRKSGFNLFPVMCPRWSVTGEDVYATQCPGMDALGDIRQLQQGERRSFEAIEKMMRPPMVGPSSLQNKHASILPGDITFLDVRDGQQGFRPAYQVQFPIRDMEFKQDQARQRIQRAFYADLFLMLANDTRSNITATEIAERKEEKLLALGPVLEQLNFDVLDPAIDLSFDYHTRQRLLPEPPPELQGMDLKVEYVSVMAQAQKLLGVSGVERFAGFVQTSAATNPEIMDKVDTDQMIDVYGNMLSIDPKIVRTDEAVAQIRQQRQQAAQAQAQVEQMNQASQAAKNLSQTDLAGDSALTEMINTARGI